jgi:cytoskeletal protein CcmA (bactofilin family)
MSYYVTNENSFLDIKNAHLRVTGNVHTDVLKLGAIEFQPTGSEVTGTVNFTNVTTGVTTSSNLNVGGTLQLGTVEVVATTHTLANTTALGNVTPHTIEVSNVTTGLVTTANVEVGRDLVVTGNVAVDTDTLFVDSVNDRVGVGTNAPVGVNGGKCLEGSSSTGFEYIATRDDTAADADDFVGAYLFKNTDTEGNEPHYAGMSAKMTGTNGPMDLRFHTNRDQYETDAVPAMTINQLGNVGIGTDDPEAKLHVKGGSICVHRTFPDTPDAGIVFMEDHSNKDCMFIAYDAGGTAETDNERLSFYSKSAGGADPTISGANLLMCMRADGNVGIGTTSPTQKLDVNGVIKCSALITGPNSGYWTKMYIGTGSTSARLYLRGTGEENHVTIYAAGSSFSDDRLKTDEELITDATDTLMKLSVQKYKKYDNFDLTGSYKNETGLIAQDIWYNAPELRHIVDLGADASGNKVEPLPLPGGVNTTHDIQNDPDYNALGWGDDEAGVLYAQLIPYLIKSNQEIYTELQAEKAKVTTLETQLISVLTRHNALANA